MMVDYATVYEDYFEDCLYSAKEYVHKQYSSQAIPKAVHRDVNTLRYLFNFTDDKSPLSYYGHVIGRLEEAMSSSVEGLIRSMFDADGTPYTPGMQIAHFNGFTTFNVPIILTEGSLREGVLFVTNEAQSIQLSQMQSIVRSEGIDKLTVVATARETEALAIPRNTGDNNIRVLAISEFFGEHFPGEYIGFLDKVDDFNKLVREELAIAVVDAPTEVRIPHLKERYLARLKSELQNMRRSLIDGTYLDGMQRKHYHEANALHSKQVDVLFTNFIDRGLCQALVGSADFADSFISSEWLYDIHSITTSIEQTGTVVGYIKSVEQLLYRVACLSKGKGHIMKRSRDEFSDWDERFAEPEGLELWSLIDYFRKQEGRGQRSNLGLLGIGHPFDKVLYNVLDSFRQFDRNVYLHKRNVNVGLVDENASERLSVVDLVRKRVQLIYLLILGGCKIEDSDLPSLGIGRDNLPTQKDARQQIREWASYVVSRQSFWREARCANVVSAWLRTDNDYLDMQERKRKVTFNHWMVSLEMEGENGPIHRTFLHPSYHKSLRWQMDDDVENIARLAKKELDDAVDRICKDWNLDRPPVEVMYALCDDKGQIWECVLYDSNGVIKPRKCKMLLPSNSNSARPNQSVT